MNTERKAERESIMQKKKTVQFTRTSDYITLRPDYKTHETRISQNRKEEHYFGGLLAVAKVDKKGTQYNSGGISAVIDCRFYQATPGGLVYCCAWLNFPKTKKYPDGLHVSGGGYAGGFGYDKQSAAFASAL